MASHRESSVTSGEESRPDFNAEKPQAKISKSESNRSTTPEIDYAPDHRDDSLERIENEHHASHEPAVRDSLEEFQLPQE